jgi:hypothetical protein
VLLAGLPRFELPSILPCTLWPPIRVDARTARSRFTCEPFSSFPRFVRRSVSGATPTLNAPLSNSVIVRHVPLTDILSPRCASPSMSCASEMVSEVPPPPLDVWSSCSRADTTGRRQLGAGMTRHGSGRTPYYLDKSGEHGCDVSCGRGGGSGMNLGVGTARECGASLPLIAHHHHGEA